MDPLTHTLVGANLGSTALGRTRLGLAAAIIGANLPDVDAILYFTGQSDLALGFRRGWTHGVLALVLLPFLLTGALLLVDRLRAGGGEPADGRRLLVISTIALLTHPFLDWLNNYGMRWLMPFRRTWFYGDAVYIMDPWLWLILGCGAVAAGRRVRLLVLCWAVVFALLLWIVTRRSPDYLWVVVAVAAVLLAAIVFNPAHRGWISRGFLATIALTLAAAYIAARLAIHAGVAARARDFIERVSGTEVSALMVSPHPIDPLRWDVVARVGDVYRSGTWSEGRLSLEAARPPVADGAPEWEAVKREPSVRGFVTWARFPSLEVERRPAETIVRAFDVRYGSPGRRGFGAAVVVIPRR